MDASKLMIPPFQPEIHLGLPWWTYLSVGKKGSGKSKLVTRAVLWYFRDKLETVVSFVPTSRSNGDPAYFVPKAFDYGDWDAERCTKIYDWWRNNDIKRKKDGKSTQHVIFVIDDCNAVSNPKNGKMINVYKTPPIVKLLKEGRHHGEGIIMCAQNAVDLPAEARTQPHMVFLFASSSAKEVEWFRSAWASHCDKKLWPHIFHGCTAWKEGQPKRCLVINTQETGSGPTSGMYVWAPPYIDKPFRCGRADYYALSLRLYKEPEIADLDPWAAGGKDAGPSRSRGGVLHGGKKKKSDEPVTVFISDPITERILSDEEAALLHAPEEFGVDEYDDFGDAV